MSMDRSKKNKVRISADPAKAIRRRRLRLVDKKAASSLLRKVLILTAALGVIFGVIFGVTPMKGGDMLPKISAGDLLLYYRLQDVYVRNDIVLMKRDDMQYVGRVIGVPGDTIEITDEKELIINDNLIVETDIFYETEAFAEATQYPLTLGNDEFFILGDHRDVAKDSRYFGPVKSSELKGKVISAIMRTDL